MDPFTDLVYRLELLTTRPLTEDIEQCKVRLKQHPWHTAMFSVLVDLQERTRMSIKIEDEDDKQVVLVDNMLLAEGVMGPEKIESPSQSVDNDEYRVQLHNIRQEFQSTMTQRDQELANFTTHTETMMKEQSLLRPVSKLGVEFIVNSIRKKFIQHQIFYKQEICRQLMSIKSKFCDARRKRRNFSKKATEILNEFFARKIASPYPTEEEKEQLARQCNISVAQVSNWFGNKRIRFKKNIAKSNEDKEINDAHRRNSEAMAMQAVSQPMMMPNPFMDPSLLSAPSFPLYFPPYDPMMLNLHPPPQPPQ